ncbi:MFS transporter [Acetobacterium woodii]|uniref:Putative membrane protein n=1 Tax=Acetobacterium woodii (strain ATCC 29683 / DSM 1030 / JCM 2381 / KCTC 1655 / WB1) TaxID=931626 RepID=H6LGC4_ACEWD|nr:APC family permease [Acetobacterium woodii]AFA47060.1 putative membrane protein [Acetobacterium woodii DSM 1030]
MKLSLGKCWGLLIFDIIGLAISGYAFLLGYQIILTLANANAYIILMGFFVGIKVIVLSLYDLNRNMLHKNIPFWGGLITIIGNGIIFAICFFLLPNVPVTFFIGLAILDLLIITLCHFLWWILIGKDSDYYKEEKANKVENRKMAPKDEKNGSSKIEKKPAKKIKNEKKTWLSREDEEESEYDSIFTTLLENEKRGQQRYVESPKADQTNLLEEKRYETSDFLNEIKGNLKKEYKLTTEKNENRSHPEKKSANLKADSVLDRSAVEPTVRKATPPKEIAIDRINQNVNVIDPVIAASQPSELETTRATKPQSNDAVFEEMPIIRENKPELQKRERFNSGISEKRAENLGDEENFLSIERRLGYLFQEIEKSMKETSYLQSAIGDFQKEVENYQPIAGDEKIVAAGNLIREKLKMIIDKQFVVDEVLDDLIRLSNLINKRINDLDIIEEGLNKRKVALDQKDLLLVEARNRKPVDAEIEILPAEVMLENFDSEFIVAEGDYESIRKYLTENPE